MRGRKPTLKAWGKFLEELADCGIVRYAAKKAKISPPTVYARKKSDPDFRKLWEEAEEIGVNAMEDEALRRAVQGTLRPVYQQGAMVGSIREYSDTLMIFMLKAKRPEKFKDRIANEHSGPNGKPIEVSDARDRIARRLAELSARGGTPEGSGGSQ